MRKNLKKLIAMGLTAVMAVSVMSVSAFAVEDNEVIYTYIQDGQEVNITQADLDAGHWDKDALGDTAPVIYENFPMSIDKFVNDIGEIYLDLVYMKKLDDFSEVHINIQDIMSEEYIYSEDISKNSFYSVKLTPNNSYIITLSEQLNGNITEYSRIVQVNQEVVDMPNDVINEEGDRNILIAAVDDIKKVETIADNGEIIIDNRNNPYTKVRSDELGTYCNSLSDNRIYRIFTEDNENQYMGFFKGNNYKNIYNYNIIVSDIDSLYTPSTLATPTSITLADVKNNAYEMRFEDYAFKIKDGSTNISKYKSFVVPIYDNAMERFDEYTSYKVKTTIRGDVSLGVYLWLVVDNVSYPISLTAENGNTTRGISIDLKASKYNITKNSTVDLYGAVYFPTATVGYGSITAEMLQGFDDDVTGSVYDLMANTSLPSEQLTFQEYTLNGGMDVDLFYLKKVTDCYKVSIRNRSVADQNKLDNGTMCSGSKEKYLAIYGANYPTNSQATNDSNVLSIYEDAIYTVGKNADVSIYSYGSGVRTKYFAAVKQDYNTISKNNYQLSYQAYGEDGSVSED